MGQYVYVVLSNSGTLPGWVIGKMTRYPYCHAMLSLTADCRELYSFGRRKVHNFLDGGFVIENRDGPFFTHFSQTQCRVLQISVTQEQFQALEQELAVFRRHAREYEYDYLGICLRYFRLKKTFFRRYTCSHFVAEVLQRSGISRFPQGTMLVRPEDFMKLNNLNILYEGALNALPR